MGQQNGKETHVRSDVTPISVPFQEKEIQLFQKNYAILKLNVDENGKTLYSYFFQHHSDLMKKFTFANTNAINGAGLEKILKDARLTFHIRRVFAIFGEIIESLTDGTKYVKAMNHVETVGMTHHKYLIQKEDFEKFKGAILFMIAERLKAHYSEFAKISWSRLIDHVIRHMLIGIERQRQNNEERVKAKELEIDNINQRYSKISIHNGR